MVGCCGLWGPPALPLQDALACPLPPFPACVAQAPSLAPLCRGLSFWVSSVSLPCASAPMNPKFQKLEALGQKRWRHCPLAFPHWPPRQALSPPLPPWSLLAASLPPASVLSPQCHPCSQVLVPPAAATRRSEGLLSEPQPRPSVTPSFAPCALFLCAPPVLSSCPCLAPLQGPPRLSSLSIRSLFSRQN